MTTAENQHAGNGRVTIWATVWKWGLIIAGFRIVWGLLLYITGLAAVTGTGIIGIIGAVVLLVLALTRFRSLNGGYLSFGQAFGIGFVTAVISTVLRSIVDSIYFATAGAASLQAMHAEVENQVLASPNMDPQVAQAVSEVFDAVFTPGGILFWSIVMGLIGWLIISLIVAAVMKKPPPITG